MLVLEDFFVGNNNNFIMTPEEGVTDRCTSLSFEDGFFLSD